MARWTQIGGDVNPKDYGAVLALDEGGGSVDIVDIEPGEEEGSGWYVTEGTFYEDDLGWEDSKSIATTIGASKGEWEEFSLAERAMSALRYHGGETRHVSKWSQALPANSNAIKWWR